MTKIQKTIIGISSGAATILMALTMFSGIAQAQVATSSTSTSSTASSTPLSADLAITKTVDNSTPTDGSQVNYTLTATALGPMTSTDVTVQDLLPSGLVFTSASSSVGSYDPIGGVWTIGDMTPSSTATLVIGATVNASSGTSIVNTASGSESASSSDPSMGNNIALATITVANATTTATTTTPAATSTLTVGVSGLVNATDTTDLSVTDLTLGTTTTATTGNGSSSFTITTGDDYNVSASSLTGYTMMDSTGCSGIISTDTVCTIVFSPVAATSTTPMAGLMITKTIDNAMPTEGSDVNYTLTVSALGPDTSTAAMATDLLPSGLTFLSDTPSVGTYSSTTGEWDIGDMPASSTATLMISAMVDPDTSGQIITNSATVGEATSTTNTSDETSAAVALTAQSATTTPITTPTSTPTSTPPVTTSTTPLNVSCDWGYDASNQITWTSSVSGGTAPYTYLWSGPQVNGATASSVTATYPTTGVVDATVQATDANSNTGSAECSASITSVVTTPTSTPPTPTSTVNIPQTLSIDANGNFLGRGIQVLSVSSGSFQGDILGITYTIEWNGKLPQFLFRNGNSDTRWVPSAQLNVGDIVAVTGTIVPSNPLVVNATVVRDYSISGPRPRFPGSNNFFEGPSLGSGSSSNTSTGNRGNNNNDNGNGNQGFGNQVNNLNQELQNLENLFRNSFGGRR